MSSHALTMRMLVVLAWTLWSADAAWATTDTTFAGPLGTVTGIVSGTGSSRQLSRVEPRWWAR